LHTSGHTRKNSSFSTQDEHLVLLGLEALTDVPNPRYATRSKYALLRQVIARRQSFFQDIQALMRYMVFDSWDHLMDFMIRGLELESQFDTT